jgi:tRNA-dihydrouridine synthase
MSLVPAHWELASRIVELRDQYAPNTLLIGNGDVKSLADATQKITESGFDGVMIGRGIFGNPWIFTGRTLEEVSPREKMEALLDLARRFDQLRPTKSFHLLKKHFKAFVSGWPGAAELRHILMETDSIAELEERLTAAIGQA